MEGGSAQKREPPVLPEIVLLDIIVNQVLTDQIQITLPQTAHILQPVLLLVVTQVTNYLPFKFHTLMLCHIVSAVTTTFLIKFIPKLAITKTGQFLKKCHLDNFCGNYATLIIENLAHAGGMELKLFILLQNRVISLDNVQIY